MAIIRVWCLIGGLSAGPEKWPAVDEWERLEREGASGEVLEGAYQKGQDELAALDAADDARAIEGFLTDSHAEFRPATVLVIGGEAVSVSRLPAGTVLQVDPSGELRYWTGESARPATWQEHDAAVRTAVDSEVEFSAGLRKSVAVGRRFSRLTDEEHSLVEGARQAGYSVHEGVAWGQTRP